MLFLLLSSSPSLDAPCYPIKNKKYSSAANCLKLFCFILIDYYYSTNWMIREKGGGFEAKQEGDHTNESSSKLVPQPSSYSSSSSSRQWSSGFSRNPRIVRVSRSFGGKDRHSKVCTIRGLRDRRIRLSVPTAIQLYDLQDRLGLTQPSKVIDWLLDVTKNDIDKLPPLQIPQELFGHHQQQQQPMMQSIDHEDQDPSLMRGATGKEVERDYDGDKNIAMPILNPYYYHWDPSNLSLSQFGSSGQEFMSQSQAQQQAADHQNSLLYGNAYHHLFVCPPAAAAATMPSLFPTYDVSNAQEEGSHDQYSSRQLINHFQLLSSNSSSSSSPQLPINSLATSSSSQVKPFSLNVTGSYPDKEDT